MKIAVTSRSFSRNETLRAELASALPKASFLFNEEGKVLSGDLLISFLAGARAAIIGLEKIDGSILARLPELKLISKYGVGTDGLDLGALKKHGVELAWKGGVNRRSVAELTLAMMLTLVRGLGDYPRSIPAGSWAKKPGRQLTGKTVGIIGLGNIGKDLVSLLRPFGCTILANDLLDFSEFCTAHGVRQTDFETVLRESDIVTLHVPLTDLTRGFIDKRALALMKREAYLINTARGGIVEETALKDALRAGRLAGAALDVFDVEPPADRELLSLPTLFSTPHIGGSSEEAVLAMGRAAIEGLATNLRRNGA
ncbi:phosphoglycerate dehydrogenase [Candidatus Parcubacteria bacterium]|nr:phosphoglycerate dehydrogenase [Candidatus Parcubacteria bacterium]